MFIPQFLKFCNFSDFSKQRVCNFLGGGGGANKVYFGWCANWQIKLSKYKFFIFRGVTILKFTCNIENLSINWRSLRAFYWHLLIFFSLENAADSLSWITSCFVKLSIIKSKTYSFFSVQICDLTLKFLKLPQIWNNFLFPGFRKIFAVAFCLDIFFSRLGICCKSRQWTHISFKLTFILRGNYPNPKTTNGELHRFKLPKEATVKIQQIS